jgi:hypothetical protein
MDGKRSSIQSLSDSLIKFLFGDDCDIEQINMMVENLAIFET